MVDHRGPCRVRGANVYDPGEGQSAGRKGFTEGTDHKEEGTTRGDRPGSGRSLTKDRTGVDRMSDDGNGSRIRVLHAVPGNGWHPDVTFCHRALVLSITTFRVLPAAVREG